MKANNGLQTRLGHGFARFGRSGSVWRWEFSWNKFFGKSKENLQHGYDKGFLATNEDIFERLKTRFFKSVLLESKYFEKANNFRVYLCSPEGKEADELIFTIRFFRNDDGTLESSFRLCEFATLEFTQGTQNYLEELFSEYTLKIKNDSLPKKKISDLVREMNTQTKSIYDQFKDAIDIVFESYEYKSHFYKVKPMIENNELLFVFPPIANLKDIEKRFSQKLLQVALKLGYDGFTFGVERT